MKALQTALLALAVSFSTAAVAQQANTKIDVGGGAKIDVQPFIEGAMSKLNSDDQTKVKKILESGLKSMRALPGTGMMVAEVEGQGMVYVSENGRFAIVNGMLIDTWNMMPLRTVRELDQVADKVVLSAMGIKTSDISMFQFGEGKKEVVMFVDPRCPYCHKLFSQMINLGKQYTFKIVMFPILGKESVEQVRKLECTENRAVGLKAMLEQNVMGLEHKGDCSPAITQRSLVVARKLGLRSVPFTIAPNGATKNGATADLAGWLSANSQ